MSNKLIHNRKSYAVCYISDATITADAPGREIGGNGHTPFCPARRNDSRKARLNSLNRVSETK